MKNKKELNSWDVLDILWKIIKEADIESLSENITWKDVILMHAEKEMPISDFSIMEGIKKFQYEVNYFTENPNRKTMRHLWGEHVALYDIWGCKEHMFTIETSGDVYRYIDGQTVCCPFCNRDIMTNEKFDEYVRLGKVHNAKSWKIVEKTAKFHRNWNRRENFKYMLENLFNKYYWQRKWYQLWN